jgi:hypothetical protein
MNNCKEALAVYVLCLLIKTQRFITVNTKGAQGYELHLAFDYIIYMPKIYYNIILHADSFYEASP